MARIANTREGARERCGLPRGMKAVFVLGNLALGGSERQALLLARFLRDAHDADVRVWGLLGGPGRLAQLCEEQDIPWRGDLIRWPDGRLGRLAEVAGFARRLRRERPDIVMPYTWLPNVVCGLAWRLSGARLCVWNQRDEGLHLNTGWLHRLAVRLTPCFIANSETGAGLLRDAYGADPGRVAVIPNGVPAPSPLRDRGAWRRQLDLGQDRLVAVMVANINHNKDHATVLTAWKEVVAGSQAGSLPPVLLLAGRFDGPEGDLKRLAFDLSLCGHVRFLGEVGDVAGLLGAADLFVHGSRSEGCPNAVLEAMAAGLPIAGTDIRGIRAAVGPNGSRHLAPPGDPFSLAGRIRELIGDRSLRAALGESLRTRAEREFGAATMCLGTADFIARHWPRGKGAGPAGEAPSPEMANREEAGGAR